MEKKDDLAEPTKTSNAKKRKKKRLHFIGMISNDCSMQHWYIVRMELIYNVWHEYVFQELLYLYYEYTGYDQIQYVFF